MVTAPMESDAPGGGAWSLAAASGADLKPMCWSNVMERAGAAALG